MNIKNNKQKRSTLSAFSLIEVMIGLAVFSTVLLAIPSAFVASRRLNTETDSQIRASMLISSELENLRTQEFDSVKELVDSTSTSETKHLGITYEVETTVSEGKNELKGMLEAVSTCSWTQDSRKREIVGRAFFAKNGLSDKKYDDGN